MHLLTVTRVSTFAVVVALVLLVGPRSSAHACKCAQPTVESSYNTSTDVVTAAIQFQLTLGSQRYYVARVGRAFKGCLGSGDWVVLSTPVESATCGARLESPSHLINGDAAGTRFGLPVLAINSCSYNVAESELTEHDLAFLDGRTVCCGDSCACADGRELVQCFVDPCQVAESCGEGVCVANYCGGCNAEFYNESGYAVCQPSDGDCVEDSDCATGEWCRQAQSDGSEVELRYECVPFAGEGQSCNGFTPAWLYERCASGLTCVTPDDVIDASGICRRGCSADADCGPQGCSGTVCAAEPVITTCEWRAEYACYDNAVITQCGCREGRCGWSQTAALEECLSAGGPSQ